MPQMHPNACTTPAVRAEIARSDEPSGAPARTRGRGARWRRARCRTARRLGAAACSWGRGAGRRPGGGSTADPRRAPPYGPAGTPPAACRSRTRGGRTPRLGRERGPPPGKGGSPPRRRAPRRRAMADRRHVLRRDGGRHSELRPEAAQPGRVRPRHALKLGLLPPLLQRQRLEQDLLLGSCGGEVRGPAIASDWLTFGRRPCSTTASGLANDRPPSSGFPRYLRPAQQWTGRRPDAVCP